MRQIEFGHYPQTADGNDSTPLEWLVLDERDGKALLLCLKAPDYRKYHEETVNITWEKCTLRSWLNKEFAEKAFTPEEYSRIVQTDVDNGSSGITKDRIFCLSEEEARHYLKDLTAAPTEYANTYGTYIRCAKTRWWLRDNGYTRLLAKVVGHDGMIFGLGIKLLSVAVRPALWVNMPGE